MKDNEDWFGTTDSLFRCRRLLTQQALGACGRGVKENVEDNTTELGFMTKTVLSCWDNTTLTGIS